MGRGQRRKQRERKLELEQERQGQRVVVPYRAWATAEHGDLPVPDLRGSPRARQLPGHADHQDAFAMMPQSFCILPLSIQPLKKFLDVNPLVRTLHLFGVPEMPVQVMTDNGRFLLQAIMAGISKQHSQNIFWDGTFSIADIWIVKYEHCMMINIQKEPVKVEGEVRQLQARVNDLKTSAAIFISLYENKDGGLPVFLDNLKEDLAGATTALVKMRWFMEYLTYHVAIMPTAGRTYLEKMLNSEKTYIPWHIMLAKPAAYPNNWKAVVQSTEGGSITLLRDVYYHKNPCTANRPDKYESTVRGLIRFMRNVLEHGKKHVPRADRSELELYLAKMFPTFLPGLMRTLLQQRTMEMQFEDVWSFFKVLKLDKWDKCSD